MSESEIEQAILVFSAICYLFIGILGSFGNIVAIIALRTTRSKQTSTSLLISNISLAILPLCLFVMPFMCAISVEAAVYEKLKIKDETFKCFFVFLNICSFVEINTIAILAFNRACAMAKPSFYRKYLTNCARTWKLLIFVWIYSIVVWIPVSTGKCGELVASTKEFFVKVEDKNHIMDVLILILCYVLPFNVAFIAHIVLFIQFRKTRAKGARANLSEKPAWESHATRTMTGVFLVLTICSVPHMVLHGLKRTETSWPRFSVLSHNLYFFRLCLDPFIYILASTKYRKDFLRVLKLCQFCRMFPSASGDKVSSNKEVPACLNTIPLRTSSEL